MKRVSGASNPDVSHTERPVITASRSKSTLTAALAPGIAEILEARAQRILMAHVTSATAL